MVCEERAGVFEHLVERPLGPGPGLELFLGDLLFQIEGGDAAFVGADDGGAGGRIDPVGGFCRFD